LLTYRTQLNDRRMSSTDKTVSEEAIQLEWQEIQAAQEDPAMFRPLYNRYYEPIFRFIFQRTADETLTADLCSQVFLKAMQRLRNYEFRGVPFSAWLYRIAMNEAAQHFRRRKKNRVVSIEDADLFEMMEEMEEGISEQEKWRLVDALDSLKEKDLELIEMRFFEHRPFKEIAEITGLTEGNAKVKTYRILDRLKKKLEEA
jgi:RNA polymerase sigma-70 factor (ECF subfamily)